MSANTLRRSRLFACFLLSVAAGCGGVSRQEIERAAECSAIREFHAQAAHEIVARGTCDHTDRIEECVPYAVIEELYVQTVKARGCT